MNVNFFQKVNNSFDLAVHFFLFGGSLYFLFYSMQTGKLIYIFLSVAVYFFSFLVRKKLIKVKDNSNFTEAGLFLISPLFIAYLLNLLEIDSDIRKYLPDKLLVESGISFVFIIIISLLSGKKQGVIKFVVIILLIATLFLLNINQSFINTFFYNNPWITRNIIGSPLIYLFMMLFGLNVPVKKTISLPTD